MASASEVAQAFATRGDGGTCGIYPDEADPEVMSRIEVVLADLARWRKEGEVQRAANVTAVTDYGSAGKTVATWVSESLVGGRLQGTLPYIHRGLLQEMLAMSDFPEPELAKRAQGVLGSYTSLPQTPRTLPAALAILTDVLKSADSSWHLRQTALPVLQTVFFRHLFSLDPKVADSVMDTIAGMLSDPQIEVRQRAAKTLAGLVRCSQRESIDQLKNRFGLVLSKTKLPARVKATQPTAEYNDALLKRHSAVLGLTSLVSSFPYEVPEWMPGVLTTLAACLDDPAPIQVGSFWVRSDLELS
jgi:proteasome activator subunit 4